jgi:hypothetical protein
MRDKLNSNPVAQMALLGVLVVAAAFLFVSGMGGGGGEGAESEAGSSAEATVAAGAEAAPAVAGAEASSATAPLPASAAASQPLPAAVESAYAAGKTVVLLVVDRRGIDDRLVRRGAPRLAALPNVAVFVVPVEQIARYAAITLSADVQRTPALVVVTPKHHGQTVPTASVAYGFQSPQSVVQAVVDAGYKGPTLAYHP